jgi:hypothetical protein
MIGELDAGTVEASAGVRAGVSVWAEGLETCAGGGGWGALTGMHAWDCTNLGRLCGKGGSWKGQWRSGSLVHWGPPYMNGWPRD